MTSLTAQEIQDQLVTLKEDARSRSPGELSRVENVAEEFFQLRVPRTAEILDVAAGSGIVSALLQTGGMVFKSKHLPSHIHENTPFSPCKDLSTSMRWTEIFQPSEDSKH